MSVDYFGSYFNDEGFNFTGLIDDDFFKPVRLLFQSCHYVSALKLLFISIDSIGFIEYGDEVDNTFIKWLNTYSDIHSLGISSVELWEQRNSLIHMSNLNSRKVKSGHTRMLVGYVGDMPAELYPDSDKIGYYNIKGLIKAIAEACGKWCLTYCKEREKIHNFVKRYDLIASDARMLEIFLEK
jgi:hypothetical protein